MSEGTCVVDGCVKLRYQKRRLCSTHTMRLHRYGDVHADRVKRRGTCSIEGCGKPHSSHGWCKEHYDRWLRCGQPDATIQRRREAVGYTAAHDRVRRDLGRASDHACVDCGGPAAQWAYDHRDPEQLVEPAYGPYPYSVKSEHYEPKCISCHRRSDLASIAEGRSLAALYNTGSTSSAP